MKTIALTGIIGSGKSTVAKYIGLRYPVIDTDQISHQLLAKDQPGYKAVVKYFKNTVLNADLSIDRSKLASIVFQDETAKKQLESLLHPLIEVEMYRQIKQCQSYLCFIEVPLLFEVNWQYKFDKVIVVASEKATIINRLMTQRGYSESEALSRFNSQMPLSYKRQFADYIINNDDSLSSLYQQIDHILVQLEQES